LKEGGKSEFKGWYLKIEEKKLRGSISNGGPVQDGEDIMTR